MAVISNTTVVVPPVNDDIYVVQDTGELIVQAGASMAGTAVIVDTPGAIGLDIETGGSAGAEIDGGSAVVDAGGSGSFDVLDGGTVTVSGVISSAELSGGELDISGSGSATDVTVESGGAVNDAGVVTNDTIEAGGSETILAGGSASTSNLSADGVTAPAGTTVHGTLDVLSGGSVLEVDVYESDAVMNISAGGSASEVGVWSSGTVNDSGLLSANEVAAGGTENILSGGVASHGTAASTGNLVEGTMNVLSGGTLVDAVVSSGGVLNLSAGASGSDIGVSAGGTLNDAGVATFAGLPGTGIGISGSAVVSAGGEIDHAVVSSGGVLGISAGGSGASIQVLSGGTLNDAGSLTLYSGSASTGVAIQGTVNVLAGGSIDNAQVSATGDLNISAGGSATNIAVSNGATVHDAGTMTDVSGSSGTGANLYGNLLVLSGGSANDVVVQDSGALNVGVSGSASNINISNGGGVWLAGGDTLSKVTFNSGATLNITPGDMISGLDIQSGASFVFSAMGGNTVVGDTIQGGTVESGGELEIASGNVVNALVDSAGVGALPGVTVDSGATVSGLQVAGGGYLYVNDGALLSATTLSAGGQIDIWESANVMNDTTVFSGLTVANGVSLFINANPAPSGSNSAELNEYLQYGTVYLSGVAMTDGDSLTIGQTTTTNEGAKPVTLYESAGQVYSSVTLDIGANLIVSSGGEVSGVTISEGGQLTLVSGAVFENVVIDANAVLNAPAAGASLADVTWSGTSGRLQISTGIDGADSGFAQIVASVNAPLTDLVVSGGQLVRDYCLLSNATIETSGGAIIYSGAIISAADAGIISVWNGASASNITVESGGELDVGGSASDLTIEAGGNVNISAPGNTTTPGSVTTINIDAGGVLTITPGAYLVSSGFGYAQASGPIVSGIDVLDGANLAVALSGATVDPDDAAVFLATSGFAISGVSATGVVTILSGATVDVSAGDPELDNITVSSGGVLEVQSGGSASGIAVESGGVLQVDSGGSVSGVAFAADQTVALEGTSAPQNVADAGYIDLLSGGLINALIVVSGALLDVLDSAVLSGAIVDSGGGMDVQSGGLAVSTVDSGGNKGVDVQSGGVASDTQVADGGALLVESGGAASDTTISADGQMIVASGATLDDIETADGVNLEVAAIGGAVDSGDAAILVSSGAEASGLDMPADATVTILSGGVVNVASGEELGSVTVSSGGDLDIVSGGSATDVTVDSGGLEDFADSATAAGSNAVTSGGVTVFQGASAADDATFTTSGSASFAAAMTASSTALDTLVSQLYPLATDVGENPDESSYDGPTGASSAATAQTISTSLQALGLGGVVFQDTSSAGSATITNNFGGLTLFQDSSNASDATLSANQGAGVVFLGSSDAGSAKITSQHGNLFFGDQSTAGASAIDAQGAMVEFVGQGSAGSATLTLSGDGDTPSMLVFQDNSTAGTAHIVNTPISDALGDIVVFQGDSTAAGATIENQSVTTTALSRGFAQAWSQLAAGDAEGAAQTRMAAIETASGADLQLGGAPLPGLIFSRDASLGSATVTTDDGGVTMIAATSAGMGTAQISNESDGVALFADGGEATIDNSGGGAIFSNGEGFTGTADSANITNSDDGWTAFVDSATAAQATIVNDSDGSTFFANANAGSATITNDGGTVAFLNGDAGSASIANDGGATYFAGAGAGSATLDQATIAVENSGALYVAGNVTGGAAQIDTQDSNAIVDFSGVKTETASSFDPASASGATLTLGALQGSGTFDLGGATIDVGSGDLDSTLEASAHIANGGANVAIGGNPDGLATLVKVGSGSLTVSGSISGVNLVATQGLFAVLGGVEGGGSATIKGGTLELGEGASAQGVAFDSGYAGGVLKLDDAQAYAGVLSGFALGDSIDLGQAYETGASASVIAGGAISVSDGGQTYSLRMANASPVGALAVTSGADGDAILSVSGNVVSNAQTIGDGQSSGSALVVSGGSLNVQSGGTADDTTVDSGGSINVDSGGSATDITVNDGGVEAIQSGGSASGGVLNDPGLQIVQAGASATGVTIAGGEQDVYGTATGSIISSGGLQVVESGGVADNSEVGSGGTLELLGGGVANDPQFSSGAIFAVGSGEDLDNYDVASGLLLSVQNGGAVSGAQIRSGGALALYGGATATDLTLASGSLLQIASAYTLTHDDVAAGTTLEIDRGGADDGAHVSGTENVMAGGVESGAIVLSGGQLNVASGGVADDVTIEGGVFTLGLSGQAGSDAITFAGAAGTLAVSGTNMPSNRIDGFASGDAIDLASVANVAGGHVDMNVAANVLTVTEGAATYQFDFDPTQNFGGDYFHLSSDDGGAGPGTLITENATPCYCRGTLIETEHGPVAVERLAIGDRLRTLSGEARRIKWIGRRGYDGRFIRENRDVLPICLRAGALADNVPSRDLWLSPHHALYLEGVLIEAKDLVNGVSIIQAERVEKVEYFHLELASHDVIFAEDAPAESFIDNESRAMFANAAEYEELYPDALHRRRQEYAPRREHGFEIAAAREKICARAGMDVSKATTPGELRGWIDGVAAESLWGWAQDACAPETPICVHILADGKVIGRALANMFRDDLRAAGLGSGRHALIFEAPKGVDLTRVRVEVRRASDGAALGGPEKVAQHDGSAFCQSASVRC